jgi:hypothetical protein
MFRDWFKVYPQAHVSSQILRFRLDLDIAQPYESGRQRPTKLMVVFLAKGQIAPFVTLFAAALCGSWRWIRASDRPAGHPGR